MQRAPSVMYPVGRCVWYGRLLLGLASALALVWAAWWWHGAPSDWLLLSSGGAACGIWGLMAWRSWRKPAVGQLHWDAQAPGLVDGETGRWLWCAGAAIEGTPLRRVEVTFDGQTVAWLRLHGPAEVPAWICLQRASDPARWHALRRPWVQAAR